MAPPEFADEVKPFVPFLSEMYNKLWKSSWEEMRAPLPQSPIPEDVPKDIVTHDIHIPLSDGYQMEARVYESTKPAKDGPKPLFYVCHGGGKHIYAYKYIYIFFFFI